MTLDRQIPGRLPEEAGLPTGAVARLLGVSPTTIRSWERRYGIGPAERVAGHHRRWSRRDVAVLEAMCRLTARGIPPGEAARAALAGHGAAGHEGTPRPGLRGPGGGAPDVPAARMCPEHLGPEYLRPEYRGPEYRGPEYRGPEYRGPEYRGPEYRGLVRAAVRLDAPEVEGILREALHTLGVVGAWTEVMMPALRAAGRRWAVDGEQHVEVEHLLSWHVSSALRGVAAVTAATRPVPLVLLAAAPTELHTLPIEATAAALTERGLPYRMLGAAVPPRALLDAVHRLGPGAVMLWSQDRRSADPELLRRLGTSAWGPRGSRAGAVVVAAGPGWARVGRPGAAAAPRTLADAVDLLERVVTD